MFEQQTFLGASITNFTSSIGFNGDSSSCTISLVEDSANGDVFNPPLIGNPVYFSYGGFTFNGILNSWEKKADVSINPGYEVTIGDSISILEGTQVILGNYSGNVQNIPNLLNVYGYLESINYGNSAINNSGMSWAKIKEGLEALFTNQHLDYGGLLKYKGVAYNLGLAFSSLNDYRFNGPSISLLDLIQQLTEAAGEDFYVKLNGSVISVNTISRLAEAQVGRINSFITSVENAKAKSVGYEARRGYTGKFLVGSNVERLYLQIKSDGLVDNDEAEDPDDADYTDDTIWPYWGKDHEGNVIVGTKEGDDHTIVLDSRHIDIPGIGDTYLTTVEELRAAAESQSAWETFLSLYNGTLFKPTKFSTNNIAGIDDNTGVYLYWNTNYQAIQPVPNLEFRQYHDDIRTDPLHPLHDPRLPPPEFLFYDITVLSHPFVTNFTAATGKSAFTSYEHNNKENPFFMRASRIGLVGNSLDSLMSLIADPGKSLADVLTINPSKWFSPFASSQLKAASGVENTTEDNIKTLYEFVSSYAQEYYGKKYMVRVPFVFTKANEDEDAEIGEIKTSQEPIPAAYLEDSIFNRAIDRNLLPVDVKKLINSENKIQAYVRFNSAAQTDFSLLSEEDFVMGKRFNRQNFHQASVFVKCDIDPDLVFIDKDTGFSPRAVITLPARIVTRIEGQDKNHFGVFNDFMNKLLESKAEQQGVAITNEEIKEGIDNLVHKPGSDAVQVSNVGMYVVPGLAAIPLKNNLQTYGPFYSRGADSQVEFEQDDTLNPWTYGSYDLMTAAGQAKANEALVNQTFDEYGSVEVPGIPTLSGGDRLISNGPYITDIRVSVGTEVTTTYSMRTWNRKTGNRDVTAKLRKLGKTIQLQKQRRAEAASAPPGFGHKYYQKRKNAIIGRNTHNSSHQYLVGSIDPSGSKLSVYSEPGYNAVTQISRNYYNTAIVSLDGIFSPVSTNPHYSGALPKFEEMFPNVSGLIDRSRYPNAESLNPFKPVPSGLGYKYSMDVATFGNQLPTNLLLEENIHRSGDFRTMALKGPLILHSWGFGTDGLPVPRQELKALNDILDISGNIVNNSGDILGYDFVSGYLEKPSTWPVGPVDLKWDDGNKMWTPSPGLVIGQLMSDIEAPVRIGLFTEFVFRKLDFSRQFDASGNSTGIGGLDASGETNVLYYTETYISGVNIDPTLNVCLGSATIGVFSNIGGKYVPVWVGC